MAPRPHQGRYQEAIADLIKALINRHWEHGNLARRRAFREWVRTMLKPD